MPKAPRKKTLHPPRNAWESALDEAEGADRSQAGEIEAGWEASGRENHRIDSDTGDGGYSGDAVEAGHQESAAQTDRPLDREIQGDPRTHEGKNYPDDAKALDERQGPLGRESLDEEDDRD